MTIKELMKEIIDYYGEYENQHIKKMVAGYIIEKIKEAEYKSLLQIVFSYHKAIFKAPCIATIKECIDKARLKDGKFEPYKGACVKPEVHNLRDKYKTDSDYEKVPVNLKEMLKDKIKKA
ncbi:MAG: hypothetical protein GY777_17680 [Candidatus Brocadiaceae bacterium]|nr:hypothetical protein [Candidatus Brocadiaceae bacterium]